jgi:hypothetical protein
MFRCSDQPNTYRAVGLTAIFQEARLVEALKAWGMTRHFQKSMIITSNSTGYHANDLTSFNPHNNTPLPGASSHVAKYIRKSVLVPQRQGIFWQPECRAYCIPRVQNKLVTIHRANNLTQLPFWLSSRLGHLPQSR